MTCDTKLFRPGLSWARRLTVTDQDGALQPLPGVTIEVEFTTEIGVPPFLTLSVGLGVTLHPDPLGTGKGLADVHATPAQTALWPLGLVYFSIITWPPGQTRDEVESGSFIVHPAINPL